MCSRENGPPRHKSDCTVLQEAQGASPAHRPGRCSPAPTAPAPPQRCWGLPPCWHAPARPSPTARDGGALTSTCRNCAIAMAESM